uniref:LigA n=1 Tax=Parastrongyloides trichosuri TaxID=131310 RepID=A0A0N4Z3Q8_PARTI
MMAAQPGSEGRAARFLERRNRPACEGGRCSKPVQRRRARRPAGRLRGLPAPERPDRLGHGRRPRRPVAPARRQPRGRTGPSCAAERPEGAAGRHRPGHAGRSPPPEPRLRGLSDRPRAGTDRTGSAPSGLRFRRRPRPAHGVSGPRCAHRHGRRRRGLAEASGSSARLLRRRDRQHPARAGDRPDPGPFGRRQRPGSGRARPDAGRGGRCPAAPVQRPARLHPRRAAGPVPRPRPRHCRGTDHRPPHRLARPAARRICAEGPAGAGSGPPPRRPRHLRLPVARGTAGEGVGDRQTLGRPPAVLVRDPAAPALRRASGAGRDGGDLHHRPLQRRLDGDGRCGRLHRQHRQAGPAAPV